MRVSPGAVSTGIKSLGKVSQPPTMRGYGVARGGSGGFLKNRTQRHHLWLVEKHSPPEPMGLTAIECPDGICHSHHGGHSVERATMQASLKSHGRDWCERLAERIYEMSVDTFSQNVMPSLHAAGWQRRHLDWEFKLNELESEPDRTLVDGIINATESFLRSSEVHRLFIQELVQGTFDEAAADDLRIQAVRTFVDTEIVSVLEERRQSLIERLSEQLLEAAKGDLVAAQSASEEALMEVERLLVNHAEAL